MRNFAYLNRQIIVGELMAKYFLMLVLGAASACFVRAQEASGRSYAGAGRFEGEVAAGPTLGYSSLPRFYRMPAGFCAALEGRYNFRQRPFDVGLRFGASGHNRWTQNSCTGDFQLTASWLAVADYNVHLLPGLTSYAGLGVGGAFVAESAEETDPGVRSGDRGAFCAMPRMGFECWRHLRITAGYFLTERESRRLELTGGLVFGGGRR